MPRAKLKRVTEPHANLRVPARAYDVEGGAIFAKNSTFVVSDGFAWTPRLRSPSPIMAHAMRACVCVTRGRDTSDGRGSILVPRVFSALKMGASSTWLPSCRFQMTVFSALFLV